MRDRWRRKAIRARAMGLAMGVVALALTAGSAVAEVISLDASGSATVYDRPEIFTDAGASPITPVGHAPPSPGEAGHSAALVQAAREAGLSPDLVAAVAWRESGFRDGAVSPKGAIGEMQLMPGTAAAFDVDPLHKADNLRGGARYLRKMIDRYQGDIPKALAAYNAGPAVVDRFGGVPPYKETRAYVAAVLDRLSASANRENAGESAVEMR